MILSEGIIKLNENQSKFIRSGWGNKVLNDVVVKKMIYESGDLSVDGYIAHPLDTGIEYPLIIWNRGGDRKNGRIDEFLAKGIFGEIASWGYTVLASQYRDKDEFGGKDVDDVLNLIDLADQLPYCDSSRIGMEGWSRGGMMSYKVLTRTNRISCAVIISGLANLFRSMEQESGLSKIYSKHFGSEHEYEFRKRLKERSAVFFAEKINKGTKFLLIHGTSDNKVSYQDSLEMSDLLIKNGVECELKIFKKGDHYLKKDRKEIAELRKEWFNRNLSA